MIIILGMQILTINYQKIGYCYFITNLSPCLHKLWRPLPSLPYLKMFRLVQNLSGNLLHQSGAVDYIPTSISTLGKDFLTEPFILYGRNVEPFCMTWPKPQSQVTRRVQFHLEEVWCINRFSREIYSLEIPCVSDMF